MSTGIFTIVESKCKVCGKTLQLEAHKECPEEWVTQLKSITACNRCADLIREREDATNRVRLACLWLLAQQKKGPLEEKHVEEIRKRLCVATKMLAGGLKTYYGTESTFWDESVVVALMQKPENWWDITSRFRMTVAGEMKKAPRLIKDD